MKILFLLVLIPSLAFAQRRLPVSIGNGTGVVPTGATPQNLEIAWLNPVSNVVLTKSLTGYPAGTTCTLWQADSEPGTWYRITNFVWNGQANGIVFPDARPRTDQQAFWKLETKTP